MLCDNLERWDGVGNGREARYLYLRLIHGDVWQKPTQYCKAIILQLKTNSFSKKRMACLLMTLEPPAETGRG